MPRRTLFLGSLFVLGVLACHSPSGKPADLVLLGGRIVTVDPARPEVEALAIRGDRIVACGTKRQVRRLVGPPTEVIDLAGALGVPGLIDSHAHFLSIGQARMQLDLAGAASWQEIVQMVATAVARAEPGEWILGRGWHQDKWQELPPYAVAGLPRHEDLSAVSPDNPVRLTHASGHSVMVNASALALAGVTTQTPDPPGGEIVRDETGQPIGVLRENAILMLPTDSANRATQRRKALLAGEECLAKGITTLHDAGVSLQTVALYRQLAEAGELPIRLWVMVNEPNQELAAHLDQLKTVGRGSSYLRIGGIKRLFDGALGSHGAWLLEPYDDLSGNTGINTYPGEQLRDTAHLAAATGLQLCVHAIGDRANREVLDVYAEVLPQYGDPRQRRWRIEHAQHLHPDDIGRFSELGVIAAMQPIHCTSDGPWVLRRIGERRARQGAYAWRSLLSAGAVICSGTDAPVEDVNPIANFHAAVTRRMGNGESFFPEQRLTREEALRSYTIDAAYAAFEEQEKGSLAVGKLADVTVLSRDIMQIPDEEILATRVLYTIVGGEVKYRSGP